MIEYVTESQFYMWRTLFAVAHVDNIVTSEEIRFMVEALEDIPFTEEQRRVLTDDIGEPRDIVQMFERISEAKYQAAFFKFARDLVWVDGHYGKEERDIMLKLKEIHVRNINLDDLIGKVDLEFEEDYSEKQKSDVKETVFSFRKQFLKDRFKG
ncbi:MAG: TerB family tellurite resistance protein [Alphaproteobacteria bacterium]|nr:TerB family tellurite resistance protein [Alphaproteobacteria bacterium]